MTIGATIEVGLSCCVRTSVRYVEQVFHIWLSRGDSGAHNCASTELWCTLITRETASVSPPAALSNNRRAPAIGPGGSFVKTRQRVRIPPGAPLLYFLQYGKLATLDKGLIVVLASFPCIFRTISPQTALSCPAQHYACFFVLRVQSL
jgi:hypothetical protein